MIRNGRTIVCGIAIITVAAACERTDGTVDPAGTMDHTAPAFANASAAGQAEINKWLADLRAAIAPFHRFEAAEAAGYSAQITGCLEQPPDGGMGFHYGNTALIDGTVEELKPELLLYEPQKNGKLRLVAVEYIVPFGLWTDPSPPSLHGIAFHANNVFGVWALHAWIWEHNPSGILMDWNPRINCSHAN